MGKRIALGFILLFAIILRLLATYPGYPPYHPDEGITYSAATSMLKNENLDPLRYDYPALTPLLNLYLFKYVFTPLSWAKFGIEKIPDVMDGYIRFPLSEDQYKQFYHSDILGSREINALTWSRIVTAFFSVGSIYLVYLVGKELFDDRVGLISAALLTVNYRAELNGVLGLPDTYNSFFLLLSFLFNLYLLKRPTRTSYVLAGICAGLSVSVKFQPFGLLTLGGVHLYLSLIKDSSVARVKNLFSIDFILSILFVGIIFLSINPYMFIYIEEANRWLTSVAGKYRLHRYQVDFYPLSYLYHFGIGKITSMISVLGLIYLFSNKKAFMLLISVLLPFFYVTIYYSGAGFYTRNFITITPFVLILAAFLISKVFSKINFKYTNLLLLIILGFVLYENLLPSLIVAEEYKKPWNYEVIGEWVKNNIPENSKVSAHSSVPLPLNKVERLTYDFNLDFSLAEFRKSGAQFSITNFDWSTNDFYWWMTQSSEKSLYYWNKPINILSETFPAKSLKELSDYSIYHVFKDEYAPESNFMVSLIPAYTSSKEKIITSFDFTKDTNGWIKKGNSSGDTLTQNENGLIIKKIVQSSLVDRWESKPISINTDIYIEASLSTLESKKRDGFIYVKYYKSCDSNIREGDYDHIRLSERHITGNSLLTFAVKKPNDSNCMVLGFQSYASQESEVHLKALNIWQSLVTENTGKWSYTRANIPSGILYPNSHGNL